VLFFSAWVTVTSLAAAWLLALNATPSGPMPAPAVIREARSAWYVLGSDCGLSTLVANRIARHAPRPDLREEVWLTTDDDEATGILRGAGFTVGRAAPSRLAALPGRRAGPWLALLDGHGQVIFSGPFPSSWDSEAPPPRPLPFLATLFPGRS
jgi:hypothetical protein